AGADELPGRDATRPPGCRDGAAADRRQATAAHRGRLRQPMCEPGAQGGVDAAHPPGRLPHSAAHGRSGGRGGQGDHLFRDPHPAAVRGTPSGPDEVVADRSATATPVGLCHLAEHSGKLTCPRERGGHAYSERGTVVHRRAEGGLTMSEPGTQPATHAFLSHRGLLFTVAYELLAPATDAADVLLVVLETLSATERVVFVLHEVFGVEYAEIAATLDKSAAAVRQIAHRARLHVQDRHQRHQTSPAQTRAVVQSFHRALSTGDLETLLQLLAPEEVYVADGGGLRMAARHPVVGRQRVQRLLAGGMRI